MGTSWFSSPIPPYPKHTHTHTHKHAHMEWANLAPFWGLVYVSFDVPQVW